MKENELSKLIRDFMWENSITGGQDTNHLTFIKNTGLWKALTKKIIDEFYSKIKKKGLCKEYWDALPFTSEHLFETDGTVHNNPTKCIHCGKSHEVYQDECLERAKRMPEIDKVIKESQIKINKLSDARPS